MMGPAAVRIAGLEDNLSAAATTAAAANPAQPSSTSTSDADAQLFQSVRLKVSSHDQEAIRRARARWTMIESGSSSQSSAQSGSLRQKSTRGRSSLPSHLPHSHMMPTMTAMTAMESDSQGTSATATPADSDAGHDRGQPDQLDDSPRPKVDYVIAVIGHDGVGKSTVIRRAIKTWGSTNPVSIYTHDGHAVASSIAEIKAGGKLTHDRSVEFIEVNLKALDLSGVAKVWPPQIPPVSGAILCYDADRRDTLRGLSEALHQLCPALPMVLFACKSDPGKKTEVDAQVGDSIGQPYNVGLIEVTTATQQGKHKMRTGLRWLLYRLEERQLGRDALRAAGAVTASVVNKSSLEPAKITASSSLTDTTVPRTGEDVDNRSSSGSQTLGWMLKNGTATSTEGSSGAVAPNTDGVKLHASTAATSNGDEIYVSLEELMNRLFSAIVSTENDQFVQSFFMTYRRFCKPKDLMKEFLDRFVEVEEYAASRDIRLWALLKLAGALVTWTSRYPGDLVVDDETQTMFRKTVNLMLKYTFLAHHTVELVAIEQSLDSLSDPDQSWSYRPPASEDQPSQQRAEVVDKEELVDEAEDGDEEATPLSKTAPSSRTMSTTSLNAVESGSASASATPEHYLSSRMTSDRTATDSSSDISRSIGSIHSGEDVSGSQKWANAIQQILTIEAQAFAAELTRMQWDLFAAIRPRDVFRHDFGKERDDPVGRSIEFFNHVSRWVSTMVMASSKVKQRAKVYEQFVKVTHQLRRLNNYDTLCAVIAGLRETSVHRLGQTHSLVKLDPALAREYQSHLKLMDPRGGYVHYRRALQADSTYGHSAIPLLTTVLSLVSRLQAGRPEDRRASDNFVQWDKFMRFGQILAVIPEFQLRDKFVAGNVSQSFRRLVEDTPVISNEDGLYERSRLIEPGGSHGGGMLRKLASLALERRRDRERDRAEFSERAELAQREIVTTTLDVNRTREEKAREAKAKAMGSLKDKEAREKANEAQAQANEVQQKASKIQEKLNEVQAKIDQVQEKPSGVQQPSTTTGPLYGRARVPNGRPLPRVMSCHQTIATLVADSSSTGSSTAGSSTASSSPASSLKDRPLGTPTSTSRRGYPGQRRKLCRCRACKCPCCSCAL